MAGIQKRPGGQWHAQFDRKADAQRWLDQVTSELVRGAYVDPKTGHPVRGVRRGVACRADLRHLYPRGHRAPAAGPHLPTFGKLELKAIRQSTVQGWLRDR